MTPLRRPTDSPLSKFIKGHTPETRVEQPDPDWRRQGESDFAIYKSLPPEVQEHLSKMEPEHHHGIIMNMRSMMPDERVEYGRSLVHP